MMKEKQCTPSPLEELLALQQRREKQREEVSRRHSLITEKESTVEEAKQSVHSLEAQLGDLERRRQDLLASYALGQASTEDVERIDADVIDKTNQISEVVRVTHTKAVNAEAAAVGLRRLLAEAELELDQLDVEHSRDLSAFLVNERNRTEERLLAAMLELRELFTQADGQYSLDGRNLHESWRIADFYLPLLPGEAFRELAANSREFVFEAKTVDRPRAMAAELERLRALGLDVDELARRQKLSAALAA